MTRKRIKVGDRIKFKAATRYSHETATRKVKGFDSYGRPLVGYAGWSEFVVHPREVLDVIPS